MVDAAVGVPLWMEAVEGSTFGKALAGMFVAVLQYSAFGKDVVYLVMLVHVEVASKNDWCAFCNLADAVYHKLRTLAPCNYAYMIHVEVEEEEFLAAFSALELSPGTNARTSGVPTSSRLLWSFRKPEVAFCEELQLLPIVEYRLMLA